MHDLIWRQSNFERNEPLPWIIIARPTPCMLHYKRLSPSHSLVLLPRPKRSRNYPTSPLPLSASQVTHLYPHRNRGKTHPDSTSMMFVKLSGEGQNSRQNSFISFGSSHAQRKLNYINAQGIFKSWRHELTCYSEQAYTNSTHTPGLGNVT